MRIVLVLADKGREWQYHACDKSSGYVLASYLGFRKSKDIKKAVIKLMERLSRKSLKQKVSLMLDSGAYTAWTQGTKIDLDEYIAFIKKNIDKIDTYFALDVIPPKPRTGDAVEASAQASYDNLAKMRKAGLKPIPVFHLGEDFKWLDRLLKDGYDYIGFGGPSWAPGVDLIPWLDRVFDRITDKKGRPTIRAHGLGLASPELMMMYPWYSCDAASWALTAAFGSIYCPIYRNKKPDYSVAPMKVSVSMEERKSGLSNDHFLRWGPLMRECLDDFLGRVGVSLEEVSENYVKRAQAIVYFYKNFEQALSAKEILFQRKPSGWLV
jgi:hypothetical protein